MGLKKLCRSWVHRGGGLASQAAGTPRRRGLRKVGQVGCGGSSLSVPLRSPTFSDSCFWAGPVSGTWRHRRESTWAPAGGARSCQGLSYFPLWSPGLGMGLAPSEHGGVASTVTGGD